MQVSRAGGAELGFNLGQPFLEHFLCSVFAHSWPAGALPITSESPDSPAALPQCPDVASEFCHYIRLPRHARSNVSTRSNFLEFLFHKIHMLMHICSADPPSSFLASHRGLSSSNPVSPNGVSTIRDRYQTIPNLSGTGKYYTGATAGAQNDRYSNTYSIYSAGMHSDPSRLLPSNIAMPTTSSTFSAPSVHDTTNTPPFHEQENFHDIYSASGQNGGERITPTIQARIEKGFFYSNDSCWTCYRRNYFAVQSSYTLTPHLSNTPLVLMKDGKQHAIQAMAMSLSARVDGTSGKAIELVQHTPKRDKGPQMQISMTKLCPTPPHSKLGHLAHAEPQSHFFGSGGYGAAAGVIPPPYLPLQTVPDPNAQPVDAQSQHGSITTPTAHQHTFERIQFKSATANNGKRRAQQQYYHLIVELYADIRDPNSTEPKYVKVAEKASFQVVVRGRSPSHYSNEGPNSASNQRGSGASGGGSGFPLGGYGGYTGFGASSGASMGRTSYNNGYGMNGGYRGNALSIDPSGMHSHSVSSSSSVAGTDGYMDHSNSMLLTSQAAPDFMQPAPVAYTGQLLPSIYSMPKLEDKYYTRLAPPMETPTVY